MADRELMENQQQERPRIRPLYRIHEEDGTVVVRMEMPGVSKDALRINIENSELKIYGSRNMAGEDAAYLIRERRPGDFSHSFTLDNTVDQNRVDASLEQGILTLKMHLKEEVKPRLIQIKSS